MADSRIPTGPLDRDPGGFLPTLMQEAMLLEVLAGVELGAYDRRIIAWLAQWSASEVRTIASLIQRARAAAVGDAQVDALLGRDDGCPYCTCCSEAGCHPGPDADCPYSTSLDRILCPCTEE
jgi:hypothetical protein